MGCVKYIHLKPFEQNVSNQFSVTLPTVLFSLAFLRNLIILIAWFLKVVNIFTGAGLQSGECC